MLNETKLKILMFSMSSYSEWQRGLENRNFHILQNLLNDSRVDQIIAVDYLPHTYKRLLRNLKENIFTPNDHQTLKMTAYEKVYQVSDKLTIYSSVISRINKSLFYSRLKGFLKKIGWEDYLVWSYYPLETSYFTELKPRLFVFDAVDNWIEHPSYSKFKEKLKKNYQIIDDRANLIFVLSEDQSQLFSHSEKIHKINNAVDLKHYQREYPIINRDIGDLVKPVIGYIGTVQDRFDLDLFESVAKNHPQKTFVIVGPIWYSTIRQRLSSLANVRCLGRKSYTEVPMYIQQFDVGIIPHRLDEFSKFTDPMKIYEYLACGKPVVTTPSANLEEFKKVVYLADDAPSFSSAIDQALKENSEVLIARRLEVVKEHSWLKRVDKMLNLIIQKL